MTQIRARPVAATAATAALAILLSACGLHDSPKVERRPLNAQSPQPPGPKMHPAAGDAAIVVVAPGMVEPLGGTAEVSGAEPGRIEHLAVQEGSPVAAGQLLARLDDSIQRHAAALATAELIEAEALRERIERGATPAELRQVEAELAGAKARSREAASAARRANELQANGASSPATIEAARAESEVLAAAADKVEARLQELRAGARREDRVAATARVSAARARLALAEAGLGRRSVVAPAAGTVLRSRAHPGEYSIPGGPPLFSIGDISKLQVRLEVDEIDAAEVELGAGCTLYSDGGDKRAEGTVSSLAPKMGRRALGWEAPTDRVDVRVREVFVRLADGASLIPGERVWGHVTRRKPRRAAGRPAGPRRGRRPAGGRRGRRPPRGPLPAFWCVWLLLTTPPAATSLAAASGRAAGQT